MAFVLAVVTLAGAATGTGDTTAAVLATDLTQTCVVAGPVPGLSTAQASNAGRHRDRHLRGRGREHPGRPDRAR